LISAQSQVYQESPVMFMFQGTLLIHYPQVLVMSLFLWKFPTVHASKSAQRALLALHPAACFSAGVHLAFACGECPTGALLGLRPGFQKNPPVKTGGNFCFTKTPR